MVVTLTGSILWLLRLLLGIIYYSDENVSFLKYYSYLKEGENYLINQNTGEHVVLV